MPAPKSTTPAVPAPFPRITVMPREFPMSVLLHDLGAALDQADALAGGAPVRTARVVANTGDVCHGCGRYIPESEWDGECIRCEPSPEQVAEAEEEKAFDALVVEIKSKPSAFANRFLAVVERVEKLETVQREAEAALIVRVDSLETIVASYERMIAKREWLADQQASGGSY